MFLASCLVFVFGIATAMAQDCPSQFTERNVVRHCVGIDFATRTLRPAYDACMGEDMMAEPEPMCIAMELKWLRRDGSPNSKNVARDLGRYKIGDAISSVEPRCLGDNTDADTEEVDVEAYLTCLFDMVDMYCNMKLNSLLDLLPTDENPEWEANYEAAALFEGYEPLPKGEAYVSFSSGQIVTPGAFVQSGLMTEAPEIYWDADPDKLYTVVVEDNGISPDIRFMHYAVYNIRGNDIESGEVVFDWLEPFSFKRNDANDGIDLTDPTFYHPYVFLIFEQRDFIFNFAEESGAQGCSPALFNRALSHEDMADMLNLRGPVAGTVVRVPYSGDATTAGICFIQECSGGPFPFDTPTECPAA